MEDIKTYDSHDEDYERDLLYKIKQRRDRDSEKKEFSDNDLIEAFLAGKGHDFEKFDKNIKENVRLVYNLLGVTTHLAESKYNLKIDNIYIKIRDEDYFDVLYILDSETTDEQEDKFTSMCLHHTEFINDMESIRLFFNIMINDEHVNHSIIENDEYLKLKG